MRTANLLSAALAASICVSTSHAQPATAYTVEPVAGAPRALGDNGPATSALLSSPQGVSVDAAGNLYIADSGNGRIRKVTPSGTITTVAGTTPGFSGDNGPATSAQLSFPAKAVAAPNGDLYIVDTANYRIRRVAPNGVITTLAGTGGPGFGTEGDLATAVQFNNPRDVAVETSGSLLVLDTNNNRLRRFTPGGRITTVAGSGVLGFYGDQQPATQAQFASPWGFAVDRTGNIYIADTLNDRVRKIDTNGTVSTIAGQNTAGYSGDNGAAVFAQLNKPTGVAVDAAGNVYIADTGNHRVRRVASNGVITTFAGSASNGFSGDNGPAASAQLNMPESLAFDAAGNLYIADTANHRVRRVSPQGIITTVAGSNPGAGDNGLASSALLFQPSGVAFDGSGNLYVADTLNHRVRRVGRDGNIVTVAGNGTAGYSGDNGFATQAQLNQPNGLAIDSANNVYIADTGNHVIRRIGTSGLISTVAGTGAMGNTGDGGQATAATMFSPNAVAVSSTGSLYIADSGNNRIRVVSSGVINAYAGDPEGLPGATGDNGPARQARFDYPRGLALDSSGNLYISDYFNNRIRRVAAGTTTITNFAGTGIGAFGGDDGPAVQARLHLPAGLAFDRQQNLYVADLLNNRIRVIGTNGFIRTIGGAGPPGNDGDFGPALLAALNSPRDVAVDVQGNVYFSDQDNNRVRRLVAGTVSIRTIVNAASLVAGWVAPGEAVSIFGTRLGPVTGVSGTSVNGFLVDRLAGTRVLFDDTPAPLLYAGNEQVNAIVPYEVAGKGTVRVQVEVQGSIADSFTIAVREAAPGIFTSDSSGRGQAAAVNENGTFNTPSNPVSRGSIVTLFVTGEGQTTPAGVTGRLIGVTDLPRPVQDVTVIVQGLPAEVLYAGAAPFSAGLMQINLRVPMDVFASSRVPIEVNVGTFAAPPGVTIAVQ